VTKHPPTRRRRPAPQVQPGERAYDSPDQFAYRLNVSRSTVWRMMADGRLRWVRIGRLRRIPIAESARFAENELM
jgi:excisionase family DNA binding protein